MNGACAKWDRIPSWKKMGEGDERLAALNTLYTTMRAPDIVLADYGGYLCPDGEFSDEVDGVSNARPDGFHLSDTAAKRMAERFLGPIVLQTAGRNAAAGGA